MDTELQLPRLTPNNVQPMTMNVAVHNADSMHNVGVTPMCSMMETDKNATNYGNFYDRKRPNDSPFVKGMIDKLKPNRLKNFDKRPLLGKKYSL